MLSALLPLLLVPSPAPDLEKLKSFVELPEIEIRTNLRSRGYGIILQAELLQKIADSADGISSSNALDFCSAADDRPELAKKVAEAGLRFKDAPAADRVRLLLHLDRQDEAEKLLPLLKEGDPEAALARLGWVTRQSGGEPSKEAIGNLLKTRDDLKALVSQGDYGKPARAYLTYRGLLAALKLDISEISSDDMVVESIWKAALKNKDLELVGDVLIYSIVNSAITGDMSIKQIDRRVDELIATWSNPSVLERAAIAYLQALAGQLKQDHGVINSSLSKVEAYLNETKFARELLSGDVLRSRASALLFSGRSEQALKLFETLQTLEKGSLASFIVSKIHFKAGRLEPALSAIEPLKGTSKLNDFYLELTRKAVAAKKAQSPQEVQGLADEYYTYLQDHSSGLPADVVFPAWLLVSVLAAMSDDKANALALVEQMVERAPDFDKAVKFRDYLKSTSLARDWDGRATR